jgi:hypothetical protein
MAIDNSQPTFVATPYNINLIPLKPGNINNRETDSLDLKDNESLLTDVSVVILSELGKELEAII